MATPSEVYTKYTTARSALEEAHANLREFREDLKAQIIAAHGDPDRFAPHGPISFMARSNQFDLSQGQIVTVSSRVPDDALDQTMGDKVKAIIEQAGWNIISERNANWQWSFVIQQKTK